MFEKAIAGGRRYWIWILVLLAIVGAGFLAYWRQWDQGLGITGLSRDVTWGLYIAQFAFLVGIAASSIIVVLPFYLYDYKAFGKIAILAEFLAISCITMGILFVFVDMGQPKRILNVLRYPAPGSMMFWDMISILGYLIMNAFITLATLRAEQNGEAPPRWLKPVVLISIPWAVGMRTVSTLLYSGLPGRSFWLTAILAPRSLVTAFAAGSALLILICLIMRNLTRFEAGKDAIEKLAQVVAYGMLINLFFVSMEIFTVFYSGIPEHIEPFEYLFMGLNGHAAMVPWMWTSILLAAVAALILLPPRTRKNEGFLWLASMLTIISLWIDKGVGLIVGGFIPSPLGAVTDYVPTIPEIAIALGIWAFGLLLLTMFYRITLSVREANS
jgi:molybdopterin-containing oxidoreductase family membrane subunit